MSPWAHRQAAVQALVASRRPWPSPLTASCELRLAPWLYLAVLCREWKVEKP